MAKDKDIKTVVPALRFPEFRNAEGWEETTLKSISPSIFDGTHQTPKYSDSGVPFYSVENIVSGNKNKFISEDDHKIATSKNCPEKGDILITRIGTIGFSKIVDWDFDFSIYVTLAVIKKSNKFISDFLHSYFQSNTYQSEILSKSLLNAVPCKINMDELRNTRIFLPPDKDKKEQQKIANCFSSLDDLISAVADKIEALKTYKKGLMQQLFPTDGKTIPTLRFPEFQNAGEWKLSSIKRCNIDAFTGYAFKGNEILEDCDGTPLMRGINITEGVVRHNNDIDRFYNGEDYTLGKYRLLCNDLVIAMDGSKVGRNFALINKQDEGSLLVQRVARLRSNSADFIMFLYQQIGSDRFKTYVDRINTSSGIPHISLKQIEDFEIWTTHNDKEIKMVTNCLSSIDELISAETDKLAQLKTHKKGLMQQLFPNLQ